jgi:hypothetical protein
MNCDPKYGMKRTVTDKKESLEDTNRAAVAVQSSIITVFTENRLSPTAPKICYITTFVPRTRADFHLTNEQPIIIMSEEAAHPTHPDDLLEKHPSAPYPDI